MKLYPVPPAAFGRRELAPDFPSWGGLGSNERQTMTTTVIDYGITGWGDAFKDGYDQDGWAQNDRVAKLVNMIVVLDKVNLTTASRRANSSINDLDGDVQTACDVIRAELISQKSKRQTEVEC